MSIISRILEKAKRELKLYRILLRDGRTPRVAIILLALAIFYAISPLDLIPDIIPIVGLLDDIIIVPALVFLALKLIPKEIVEEHRVGLTTA